MGPAPVIPLSGWADRQLQALAKSTGSTEIAALTGVGLLGERATRNGFRIPGQLSAGGGCRLYKARDGWLALSLARPDDRTLLPALFGDSALDPEDDKALSEHIAASDVLALSVRGAEFGLAIAAVSEGSDSPVHETIAEGRSVDRKPDQQPLVIDLTALWAGPLATHLLTLAGAQVVKVESRSRPDAMRTGDPAFFDLLNQRKASVAVDLHDADDRAALIALIRRADVVIESSRPRALLQLGIDADALVAETPGLVWISITGHGVRGASANRVGFGDDCGVAGGLTTALHEATGTIGFVGDAIADPLTGIAAARLAWEQWASGKGGRIFASMSGTVAAAIAEETQTDSQAFAQSLHDWAKGVGQPFPSAPLRPSQPARPFGADTQHWLGTAQPC